jgi:hypothetical protein
MNKREKQAFLVGAIVWVVSLTYFSIKLLER